MKSQPEDPIEERFDVDTTPNGGIFADRPDPTPDPAPIDADERPENPLFDDGQPESEDDPAEDADEFAGRESSPQK